MKTTELDILKLAEPGKFIRVRKIIPAGTLEVRKAKDGRITFYWRGYYQDKNLRVAIGLFDSRLPPKAMKPSKLGYTINGAADKAREIAIAHHDNIADGGYAGLIQKEKEQKEAQAKELEALSAATLEGLLTDYTLYLKHKGRQAHKQTRTLFDRHVFQAHPDIAQTVAKDVTSSQIADITRTLVEAGIGRSANKLYAYIHAAYQVALIAKHSDSVPARFKAYRIDVNPAAAIVMDSRKTASAKNPVSTQELKKYWSIIRQLDGLAGAVLQLHFLMGSPRIAQLARLKNADVKDDYIILWDLKGKPGTEPRQHVLPLTAPARKALGLITRSGEYAFSTGGDGHVSPDSVSRWAREIVGDQIPGFQLKRIRSGCETLLASKKVSKDIRGRLQSHGISGIQDQHYDAYDYLDEKREALEIIFNEVKAA